MLGALLALAGVGAAACGPDGSAERPYQPTVSQYAEQSFAPSRETAPQVGFSA